MVALLLEATPFKLTVLITLNLNSIDKKFLINIVQLAALAGNQADQEVIDSAKSQFEHINGILEADYLTGDCLTIVDMFAFSMVANIMLDPKFVKPDGIDNLNAWVHRIRAKPYFAETHKSFFAVKQSIAASSAAAEQ